MASPGGFGLHFSNDKYSRDYSFVLGVYLYIFGDICQNF